MSEFDDFIRGLGSDIKNAAEQVGKKAEETFEISKRRAEKIKIKGHINSLYQRLGELTYGGMKNGEDVSEEQAETIRTVIEGKLPNSIEVNTIYGGQPVYYYIISAE